MKTTFKNMAIALTLLAMVMVILTAVDKANDMNVLAKNTSVKVTVVDLDNMPVHNAKITIGKQTFVSDNNGNSPIIVLEQVDNCYDASIEEWFTANVLVTKQGYVPTVVVNCIIFNQQTRKLTVKIYPTDQSELPYVCYVETPPDDYLKGLITSIN